jgi:hypothetical protein
LANSETSVIGQPLGPANGQTWVAAEMTAVGGRVFLRVWKKRRRLAESSAET